MASDFHGFLGPNMSDFVPGAGGGFPPRWPPPEGASVQKEWHKQDTIELRNHLVSELIKALIPSPNPAAMHDPRVKKLIQYASKVEKETFELANDREEYSRLMAEKICKIEKGPQEKKKRRLEPQQNRPTHTEADEPVAKRTRGAQASSSRTTSFNMSNGPGFGGGGGSIGHHAQLDNNNSFIAGQQQQPHPGSGIRGPAPSSFGLGTNSKSGNSVLEELLLTNRAPSSSAVGGPGGGGHQQPMIHHQATNSPNVTLLPTMNQRTPLSNVMNLPNGPRNIVNRNPMMNNLASPPNGPVGINNIVNRPSMGVFSPDRSGNMCGGALSQYGMAPDRIRGPQQIGMNAQQHQQQMMMGAGGMRGPPPSSMNGPHQMNAGMGGPPMNMARGSRPNTVPNQQPPNQQTMPFNASMHVQQQQHINVRPSMHMNVARMNRPYSNSLMAGNASCQQGPHAGQQQPFGAVPMQQPPPQLGKSASIPVGVRPEAHSEPPAMPAQSISSPLPAQAGDQLPPPNQRGRLPSNVNMLNSNPNVAHMNVPSNMDMVGGGSGMGGQQQLTNADPGPSSMGNLPQQSPASAMLMSPTSNLLSGSGGSGVPPATGDDVDAIAAVLGSPTSFDGGLVSKRSSLSDSLVRAPATAAALSSTHLAANANGDKSSAINGGSAASSDIEIEDQNLSVCEAGSSSSTTPAPKYESSVKMTVPDGDSDKPTTSTGGDAAATESNSLVKIAKKVFTVEELKNALLPILDKLERMDDAIPFRVPVDPDLLGIPDYFDAIRNPMDLSTMKEKLLKGDYTDPWQFCDDMWLMFDNARLWNIAIERIRKKIKNRNNPKVYKYCPKKLYETFADDIDPVMRSLGYCCGQRLSFTKLALVCYGQPMCAIPHGAIYYCYEDNKSQFGVKRYTYCKNCFNETPSELINLSDDPNSENLILKKNFKKLKNDPIEYEPFLECVDCGRKWHQICALHKDEIHGGFVCESCLRTKVKKRPENRFSAKRMAHCKLSLHLEKRVNDYLKNNLPPDQPAGEVIIRVLSSGDKEVEIKPQMKSKFCTTGQFPEKFPYRAKAIFAFEVIDGVEVCFFGLHVQEFGSECPAPNNRRVYIAYLDSVHFFTPKHVRTQAYHEILLGYLDYVKKLGYTMAHIWSCPPISKAVDYIFHCRPPEQFNPTKKRLRDWYKKLLDRGIVEGVVTDYKDIYEFYQEEEPLKTIAELPYFEGDDWPDVIEKCILKVDAEPRAAAARSTYYRTGTGNDLADKIVTALETHKEEFFVVRLTPKQSASALPVIVDPDPNITCDFMDDRYRFLSTARDRHWEFNSLRRAKFSTLALCYEWHTQGKSIVGADGSTSNQEQGAQNREIGTSRFNVVFVA